MNIHYLICLFNLVVLVWLIYISIELAHIIKKNEESDYEDLSFILNRNAEIDKRLTYLEKQLNVAKLNIFNIQNTLNIPLDDRLQF